MKLLDMVLVICAVPVVPSFGYTVQRSDDSENPAFPLGDVLGGKSVKQALQEGRRLGVGLTDISE